MGSRNQRLGTGLKVRSLALITTLAHFYSDYVERVMNLPSVQRTLSDSQRYEEVYGRYLRNESQSEVAKSTRAGRLLP